MAESPPRSAGNVGANVGGHTGTAASAGAGSAIASGKHSVIQLTFHEKGALYAAYVPLFLEGGLFVPTLKELRLGDEIGRASCRERV